MAKARKPKRGKHKTEKPELSRQDIKFAQLLFDRDFVTPRKSTVDCYLEAGFPPKETTHATEMAAHRRVKRREFREYYRAHQKHVAEAAKVTSAELLAVVANYVRADRRKLFGRDGAPLPPGQWPDDVAACVEDFDMDTVSEVRGEDVTQKVYVKKIRTVSRLAAAVKLMEATRIIGPDADAGSEGQQKPLVVKGADPDKL